MTSHLDPFSRSFDAIEIDPARAPSPAAIDRAMAHLAPTAAAPEAPESPGFYLRDDAGGRFIVDRDMGVVSVRDDSILQSESGAIYQVRLHVIEASGATYDLDLKLRITGRVPQMVGAEDINFLSGAPIETPITPTPAPPPSIGWNDFSAGAGAIGKAQLGAADAPLGALLPAMPLIAHAGLVRLQLFTPQPAPSASDAVWSV